MSLITRCAHCHTVFRITAEQLQAHGGQVRCGRCMQVFNGLSALSPDVAMAANPVVTPSQPGPVASAVDLPTVAAPPQPLPPEPFAAQIAEPEHNAAEPLAEIQPAAELLELVEPQPVAATDGPAITEHEPAAADNPFLDDDLPPDPLPQASGPRRLLAATACLLLLLGLAVQAVYYYRGEIAARHVQAREWLGAACVRLGCSVELPQRPKSLLIEASDLQSIDPARPERIQLTATLRNHAGFVVAYPALDLVLTNVNDHTLARRIFLPHEYLGGGRDPRAGIAANAELTVRIGLETGNLGAAGFRLAVLPAPSP